MMQRCAILAFTLMVGTSPPVALSAQESQLPLPTEWQTHYVWFLVANPAYRPASESADSAITAAHVQYQLRLQYDGDAIVAGGLGPGEDRQTIGLTILRAQSLSAARALAEGDPAVKAGKLSARVREWWVPAGRLPPPRHGRP